MPSDAPRSLVGVDTGGTFTDFVLLENGALRIHKEPSTPDDPSRAIVNGLAVLLGGGAGDVIHGSTVATNALLERKGARAAMFTTAGFEDVIEIGRQTRRSIYDINVTKTPPLVEASLRRGIVERLDNRGEVVTALEEAVVQAAVDAVSVMNVESVAVCLLHSYANSDHEVRIAAALRARYPEMFVTASHEVLPEFREYERFSTTTINAYVGPVMRRYLGKLADALSGSRVQIMQSNGGVVSLASAQRLAVNTVLSGPAGGAVAGFDCGRRAGHERVISFDMGGTSTDVSLADGAIGLTSEGMIGELPVRVPIIDIHTVGAGGGSIAWRDQGGSLRVGPQSAGAQPGPICYGRGGTEVTVTDANLYLGRLSASHFLGGAQKLDVEGARRGVERLAAAFGLSAVAAAEGVLRVANATMERAIRVISLERGHDPRDFALICFGGAGGMHAADLASSLGIPRVIVPPAAGALSALGMLLADFVRDYSRTLLVPYADGALAAIEGAFSELETAARADCEVEGIDSHTLSMVRTLDMRYAGQGYELTVPMDGGVRESFNRAHEQRYGYADPSRALEVVNVRLRATSASLRRLPDALPPGAVDASVAKAGEMRMIFDGVAVDAPIVDRELLTPGNRFDGPALIVEYSTTTVVPPRWRVSVDGHRNLVLEQHERIDTR